MANELVIQLETGLTIYAQIRDTSSNVWDGSSFEVYDSGDWLDYDITITEQGASGIYYGDFPSGITTGSTYEVFYFLQEGGSPAEGDPAAGQQTIDWTGYASVGAGTGSMSGSDWYAYVLRRGFKRTDKETEVFEATTDAIQEMRRRYMFDEAKAEATTTDTITVEGDFRLTTEADFGLILGVVLEDDDIGTNLIPVNKSEFDRLYPSINVDSDPGYPKHFCIYGEQIFIGPIPDSVDYVYRISYSRRAGTVTIASSGVPFTNLYRDVLCDNVLMRLYRDLESYDKADRHEASFEKGFLLSTRRENMNSKASTFMQRPTNF